MKPIRLLFLLLLGGLSLGSAQAQTLRWSIGAGGYPQYRTTKTGSFTFASPIRTVSNPLSLSAGNLTLKLGAGLTLDGSGNLTATGGGGGGGNMTTTTYDTNGDGVVDNSERLNGQVASYYQSVTAFNAFTATLGSGAFLNVATTGDASTAQLVKGNDSRLSDARPPTAHNQALNTITGAGTAAAKDVPASGNASTTQVVLGNDSRLSDSRPPTGPATGGDFAGTYPNNINLITKGPGAGTYGGGGLYIASLTIDANGRIVSVVTSTPSSGTTAASKLYLDATLRLTSTTDSVMTTANRLGANRNVMATKAYADSTAQVKATAAAAASTGALSVTAQVVTSGTATSMTSNWLILNPSSTLATHAVTLPTATYDGQVVEINAGPALASGTVVTSFSIANAATLTSPVFTAGAFTQGDYLRWRWNVALARYIQQF